MKANGIAHRILLVLGTAALLAAAKCSGDNPPPQPTPVPTLAPTLAPTAVPTLAPTPVPTDTPSPSPAPTVAPTLPPTPTPTPIATLRPTASPTEAPTAAPTARPTHRPRPTPTASVAPTAAPSVAPTAAPTARPTAAPTARPTAAPSANPTVAPTAPPTSGNNALPWVYSQIFSSGSPFHKTVAQHKSEGATVDSQSEMTALWSQGVVNYGLGQNRQIPVYVASASDPVKTISCTMYGQCNANGKQIHVPASAVPQGIGDSHIIVIDPASGYEFDGWQCSNGSTFKCSWGGLFTLGGNGISNSGSEGVHGGFAVGLFFITPQEIINGHIDHALGLNTSCLSSPNVYPADQNNGGSDANCGGTAHYGSLVHLLWSPSQIASSAYSSSCKVVLTALATYGAFTYDTGNGGLELASVGSGTFTGTSNQWSPVISNMQASGDASGGAWRSCLNRLSASDFEVLTIKAGSYKEVAASESSASRSAPRALRRQSAQSPQFFMRPFHRSLSARVSEMRPHAASPESRMAW